MLFGKKNWDPSGKHCYITGGSSGLGLGLAVLLVQRGAHVSVVARNQERIDKALERIQAARCDDSQQCYAYSYAVDTAAGASASLDAASTPFDGRCPDAVFLCAGRATPGFFVEQSEEMFEKGMRETYWAQAWSALAASKRMVRDGVQGKIVFVASVLAYFGLAGYSPYTPGKFAIRGLAESLHSELLLYSISVQIVFPGTIFTPGYDEENTTKPTITLKLESTDGGMLPESVAAHMLKGVISGKFHITYDFIGNVFRASSRGSSPGNGGLLDQAYALIGAIALPFWRRDVDRQVRAHRPEHLIYLKERGLSLS